MTGTLDQLLPTMEPPHFGVGNARCDSEPFHDWLIGHFVPATGGLRHSEDIEIKWGIHPQDSGDNQWTVNRLATSISILVSGVEQISLPHRTFTLSNPGDYLVWGPGMPHRWQVMEDSVVITVRWPSIPDDNIEASDAFVEHVREQLRSSS